MAELGRPVHDRHLIVVFEFAVAERLENAADAAHAERMQFRGPQGAHACAAEEGNPARNRPQDLLVPDRWGAGEISIDDSDRPWSTLRGAIDVALGDWRQADDVPARGDVFGSQRRADENDDRHARRSCRARARAPGA